MPHPILGMAGGPGSLQGDGHLISHALQDRQIAIGKPPGPWSGKVHHTECPIGDRQRDARVIPQSSGIPFCSRQAFTLENDIRRPGELPRAEEPPAQAIPLHRPGDSQPGRQTPGGGKPEPGLPLPERDPRRLDAGQFQSPVDSELGHFVFLSRASQSFGDAIQRLEKQGRTLELALPRRQIFAGIPEMDHSPFPLVLLNGPGEAPQPILPGTVAQSHALAMSRRIIVSLLSGGRGRGRGRPEFPARRRDASTPARVESTHAVHVGPLAIHRGDPRGGLPARRPLTQPLRRAITAAQGDG